MLVDTRRTLSIANATAVTLRKTNAQVTEPACHDARDLTEGRATARITLDDQIYVLRITRAGKLILTK